MRTSTCLAVAAALLLTGCGAGPVRASDGGSDGGSATDPATDPAGLPAAVPTAVPAAEGLVRTRDLATVMDRGDGPPELCLGPVAESYPPQCGGPALVGWDWADHQAFERQGRVRWGSFAVTGRWDGERFTVTSAVPAALHSPLVVDEPSPQPPATSSPAAELQAIAEVLGASLAGAQGAYADPATGRVVVDVTYDDGSLQAWADERYGAGVVAVTSILLPADA